MTRQMIYLPAVRQRVHGSGYPSSPPRNPRQPDGRYRDGDFTEKAVLEIAKTGADYNLGRSTEPYEAAIANRADRPVLVPGTTREFDVCIERLPRFPERPKPSSSVIAEWSGRYWRYFARPLRCTLCFLLFSSASIAQQEKSGHVASVGICWTGYSAVVVTMDNGDLLTLGDITTPLTQAEYATALTAKATQDIVFYSIQSSQTICNLPRGTAEWWVDGGSVYP